jgi:hypothetical protein
MQQTLRSELCMIDFARRLVQVVRMQTDSALTNIALLYERIIDIVNVSLGLNKRIVCPTAPLLFFGDVFAAPWYVVKGSAICANASLCG